MIFFAYVLKTGFSYPSTAWHHVCATGQSTGIPAFSLSLSFSFPFTFVFSFTFAFTFSFIFAYPSPISSIIFLLCSIYFRIPRLSPPPPPRAGRADNFSFSNSVSIRSLLHFTCCTSRVTMASGGMEPGAFKTYDPTVHLYSTAPTLPSTAHPSSQRCGYVLQRRSIPPDANNNNKKCKQNLTVQHIRICRLPKLSAHEK